MGCLEEIEDREDSLVIIGGDFNIRRTWEYRRSGDREKIQR